MEYGNDFLPLAFLWVVMMAAMMLPSSWPMVLALNRVSQRLDAQDPLLPWLFGAGYAGIWLVFSLIAAGMQWSVRQFWREDFPAWLTPFLFLVAGLYQFSPWKQACLQGCRTPFAFLMTAWRNGRGGAVGMGVHHGVLCVGCCWALMMLMFGVGMMSFYGMVVITVLITLEKLSPIEPRTISGFCGILLLAWAAVLTYQLS
ncbi:MAG: DUF2182 domain-containing protein [Methylohalobius sp. ZOD2]|nr:DUF2182 domain-containing protein [Methylothermaceae bacterium]